RACIVSSSISASRTTARSMTTPPPCSIGCAARCSIPPTSCAGPATVMAISSSLRRAARIGSISSSAASVERAIEEALAPMVSEVLREQPRITVGHARVLGNSLVRPERLTARLVTDAGANARNLRERKAHRDRTTLQDVILGEGLTSVYQ